MQQARPRLMRLDTQGVPTIVQHMRHSPFFGQVTCHFFDGTSSTKGLHEMLVGAPPFYRGGLSEGQWATIEARFIRAWQETARLRVLKAVSLRASLHRKHPENL